MYKYIPNLITLSRIVLTIPILILLYHLPTSPLMHALVFLLALICSLGDTFDGYLARRWKCTTSLGKWLDPLADKVLVLTFVPLWFHGMIHLVPVIVIILRDAFSTWLRHRYSREVIGAKTSGRIKTVVNLTCMCFLIAALPIPGSYFGLLAHFRTALYYTTGTLIVAVCIWSGLDYYRKIVVQQKV